MSSTALPIQISAAIQYTPQPPGPVDLFIGVLGQYVAQAGTKYESGIFLAPTTAGGAAIPVSSLANLGYAVFVNLDPVNYVELLTAASGTNIITLQPGDVAVFRFGSGIAAPALLAHTDAVEVQYLILEN
jgi:hypothetical protein